MNNPWMKRLAAAVFATSMMSASALAQDAYTDWNANSDAGIDQNEFNTGFGDRDVYGNWDANDDSVLDDTEWGTGIGDRTEPWNERFGESAWNDWNTDGADGLTEDEFNAGVFGGYDEDDSGYIEEPEFGDYGDDVGDGGLFDV